jgi:hypothetical protein
LVWITVAGFGCRSKTNAGAPPTTPVIAAAPSPDRYKDWSIDIDPHVSPLVLEDASLRVTFDAKTGALTSFMDKASGWPIQDRATLGRSFQLLVPLPDRRNNRVMGTDQRPPQVEKSPDGKRITMHWARVRSEHGGSLDIDFDGTVELLQGQLRFTGRIANRSPYVVEAVHWPYLGDMTVPPGAEKLERLSLNYAAMQRTALYPKFDTDVGASETDYPMQWALTPVTPFVLADTGRTGLYIGYHDASNAEMVQFAFELLPGFAHRQFWSGGTWLPGKDSSGEPVHMQAYTVHFPFLPAGQTANLPPIVVAPYHDGWQAGVDIYKAWRKTWYHPPPAPDWLRDVHSWQQIQINTPEDDLRFPFSDVVKYAEDCKRHGVTAIQLVGWNSGGQDRNGPSHDADPRLGGETELARAIEKSQALGVKIVLFSKFTWADQSTEWFRRDLVRHAIKNPYGDYTVYGGYRYQTPTQLVDINTRRMVPMCPMSADYRKLAASEFSKVAALGADGMLYDESAHHGGARYCFASDHGHSVPAHVYQGDNLLAQAMRATLPAARHDFVFGGEGNYDTELAEYPLSYFRITPDHVPLHRYIDSDTALMVAVMGYDDRATINQALLYRYIIEYEPRNFKGRLDEYPKTLTYGKLVDALRRRFRDVLWDAEFRSTLGASVTSDGKPVDTYSVFVGRSGKRSIVVVNNDERKSLPVVVTPNAPARPLVFATPEAPDPVSSDGRAEIPPRSAVVFMER